MAIFVCYVCTPHSERKEHNNLRPPPTSIFVPSPFLKFYLSCRSPLFLILTSLLHCLYLTATISSNFSSSETLASVNRPCFLGSPTIPTRNLIFPPSALISKSALSNSTERLSSSRFGTQLDKSVSAPSPRPITEVPMVSLSSTTLQTMSPSIMSSNGCTKLTGMLAKTSTSFWLVISVILKESEWFPLNREKSLQMGLELSFWRHLLRPPPMLSRLS
eukprot:CCRYP_013757-RB/>CCRYP_013757-RB protein AED:0.11 eAED:0.11 QI:503/1/1/1/1/1/2/410/217